MTFMHKLSRRLAQAHEAGFLLPGLVVLLGILIACEIPGVAANPNEIAQVVVVPESLTVDPGQRSVFHAHGITAAGDSASLLVSWSATGGAIDQSGAFTADTNGAGSDVSITASSPTLKLSASSRVHVRPRVSSLLLSPSTVMVPVAQTTQLALTVLDSHGNPVTGVPITWTSSNTAAAVVSGTGLVTGVAAGTAAVSAAGGGKSATSAVTVMAVPVASVAVAPTSASVSIGQSVQLTATPKDANGNPLTGRAISWASGNTGVATVNAGLVMGAAAGSTTITATSEGQSGTSTVTVSAIPVASVSVTPGSASIVAGQSTQLTAMPKDANGNPLTGRVVTWTSSNTAAVAVSAGLVTGKAAGSATITATSEGRSGTSMITVTVVPVASVTVSPSSASLTVGQTTQLTATPKDANGNPLTGRTITWTSGNTAAATVNSSGLVTGASAGSATITATSEGQSGTSMITVTIVPVASVTVSPSSASLTVGQTTQLTATPKDANGNPLTGRTITWTSGNTAVATVNTSGLVTGASAGSTTITATSGGQSGTSAITVTVVPVASVTVAPASLGLTVGQTGQLGATVKDANGNVLTGRTITWTSNNTGVATVNASGLVTAVAVGTAMVTASCGGQSGTSNVSVSGPSGGGTVLFQESFENTSFASRGWYDNTSLTITTTTQHSGSSALEAHFLPGATTPTWGGSMRHLFTATPTLYISYWVRYSDNWVGSGVSYHPHEFTVLSDLDGDYDGPSVNYLTIYLEHNYQNGGIPRMSMQDNKSINSSMGTPPINLVGVTENRSTSGCNGVVESNVFTSCYNAPPWYNGKEIHASQVWFQPNPGPGYKGNWNHVEAYYQINSIVNGIGQADGVMQYWFNGTLAIDRHDILYRTGAHPSINFHQFLIAPYIGNGSPVDQTMWVDDLIVATSHP